MCQDLCLRKLHLPGEFFLPLLPSVDLQPLEEQHLLFKLLDLETNVTHFFQMLISQLLDKLHINIFFSWKANYLSFYLSISECSI